MAKTKYNKNKSISVCVFCGASDGKNHLFKKASISLGQKLAENKIGLIYGGGSLGLMGTISNSVSSSGGRVLGVIPKKLLAVEGINNNVDEVIITEDMHSRKMTMYKHSQAFICLPGGVGTLEELLEVITWSQLNISRKPIFILNICGYWDKFKSLIHHVISEGFAKPELLELFSVHNQVESLISSLLTSLRIESKE